jgi:exopolysaccharide production protein ExoQ
MRQLARPAAEIGRWSGRPVVRSRSALRWESALIVVAAVMFATNVVEIVLVFHKGGSSYPPQVQLTYLMVYAISGLLLLSVRSPPPWTLPLRAPSLALVLAMPLISIFWSVDPGETLQRGVAVFGTSLFGAYLGWRFTLGRLIFLLAIAMAIAVALSLVAIFMVPSIGIDSTGRWAGTWIGVYFHKNGLGNASALACLIIGYAITDSRGYWRLAFCGAFVGALVLLVGSRSATALVAAFMVGAFAIWVRCLQVRPSQVPVLTVILAGAAVAIIATHGADLLATILESFDKRSDLSRFPLWQMVWSFIARHFWLGYGYEAFWQPDSPQVRFIAAKLFFVPFYSHNGLLETWLNGGLVLVGLVCALLLTITIKGVVLAIRWRSLAISSFPLAFLFFFLFENFTESSVLARNTLEWSLLVTVAAFVARWVRLRPS